MIRLDITPFLIFVQYVLLGISQQPCHRSTSQTCIKAVFSIIQLTDIQLKKCVLHCYLDPTESITQKSAQKCCNTSSGSQQLLKENGKSPTDPEKSAPSRCKTPTDPHKLKECGLSPEDPGNICKEGWVLQCYPTQLETPYCVCDPCTEPNECRNVCNYVFRPKWDFPFYGDIEMKKTNDPFECFELCRNMPKCESVVYEKWPGVCWFKNVSEFTSPTERCGMKGKTDLYSLICPKKSLNTNETFEGQKV